MQKKLAVVGHGVEKLINAARVGEGNAVGGRGGEELTVAAGTDLTTAGDGSDQLSPVRREGNDFTDVEHVVRLCATMDCEGKGLTDVWHKGEGVTEF